MADNLSRIDEFMLKVSNYFAPYGQDDVIPSEGMIDAVAEFNQQMQDMAEIHHLPKRPRATIDIEKRKVVIDIVNTHPRPIVNNGSSTFQDAIDRGDYTLVDDNYLTVWLNGDEDDAYELHRDEDEWRWET